MLHLRVKQNYKTTFFTIKKRFYHNIFLCKQHLYKHTYRYKKQIGVNLKGFSIRKSIISCLVIFDIHTLNEAKLFALYIIVDFLYVYNKPTIYKHMPLSYIYIYIYLCFIPSQFLFTFYIHCKFSMFLIVCLKSVYV